MRSPIVAIFPLGIAQNFTSAESLRRCSIYRKTHLLFLELFFPAASRTLSLPPFLKAAPQQKPQPTFSPRPQLCRRPR